MKKYIALFFQKIEWKFALKGALAAGISLLLGQYVSFLLNQNPNEILIGGLWTSVAAIIASQVHLGSSFKAGGRRILGTFIGAVLGTLFAFALGTSPLSFGISIFFTFVFCILFDLRASIPLAGATVAVVMVLSKINVGESTWKFALFRLLDSIMGVFVAIVIAYLILPERATTKMQINIAEIFESLERFYKRIISLKRQTLSNEEPDTLEKDLEEKLFKNRLFLEDVNIELLMTIKKHHEWENLHLHAYKIYDTLVTLNKLALPKEAMLAHVEEETAELLAFLTQQLQKKQKEQEIAPYLIKISELKEELTDLNKKSMLDSNFYIDVHLYSILLDEIAGCSQAITGVK